MAGEKLAPSRGVELEYFGLNDPGRLMRLMNQAADPLSNLYCVSAQLGKTVRLMGYGTSNYA